MFEDLVQNPANVDEETTKSNIFCRTNWHIGSQSTLRRIEARLVHGSQILYLEVSRKLVVLYTLS